MDNNGDTNNIDTDTIDINIDININDTNNIRI